MLSPRGLIHSIPIVSYRVGVAKRGGSSTCTCIYENPAVWEIGGFVLTKSLLAAFRAGPILFVCTRPLIVVFTFPPPFGDLALVACVWWRRFRGCFSKYFSFFGVESTNGPVICQAFGFPAGAVSLGVRSDLCHSSCVSCQLFLFFFPSGGPRFPDFLYLPFIRPIFDVFPSVWAERSTDLNLTD